jgi:hypothetical protein
VLSTDKHVLRAEIFVANL